LKEIYFQSHSEEPEMHALSEGNMPGSVCWALMHGPAAYFLLTMGVGFKMILGYAKEPVVDPVSRYTLGFSILGVIYSFIIIRSSHNKFVLPLASILIRFPIAALAPLGAVFIQQPLAYISWCFMVVWICRFLDVLLLDRLTFEIDKDFVTRLKATKLRKAQKINAARNRQKEHGHADGHHAQVEMHDLGHGHGH